jgi:hypothetical protein
MELSKEDRKEAIRKFKERKVHAGIYVVRCAESGRAWVGPSRNLDASRNSTWMMLRQGSHRDAALQAEWNARGEAAFEYEIAERFDDDLSPLLMPDRLKSQLKKWGGQLNAARLL